VNLTHYGKAGLRVLDPRHHGTGCLGEERRRKENAYPGDYVDRIYYYLEGATPERRVV